MDGRDQACGCAAWLLVVAIFALYTIYVLLNAYTDRENPPQSVAYHDVQGEPELDVFPSLVSEEGIIAYL